MTIEHKLVVGLSDLTAIIFACRHDECAARVIVPPNHSKVPECCPGCGREWLRESSLREISITSSTSRNFVQELAKLRSRAEDAEMQGRGPKFDILLEFDNPAAPKPQL
jgi:hypothetical protein